VTPVSGAADCVRRFLAGRGRHDPFDPAIDGPAFARWLCAVGLRDRWDACRQAPGGTDAAVFAAVRGRHPELIAIDPATPSTPNPKGNSNGQ
jgi:hypothetical protein